MISGDKTKMQAYCDLSKLEQQVMMLAGKKDAQTLDGLDQRAADLEQKLGPDYAKLMDGLDQVDENSGEGNGMAASFDEVTAALNSLDNQCK